MATVSAGNFPTTFDQRVLDIVAHNFWSRVKVNLNMDFIREGGIGPCWEWHGARTAHGYGMFNLISGAKRVLAHRLSYALTFGNFDESLGILHRCDNPRCVRPDHLYPGDQKQNMKDAYDRGRRKSLKGTRHLKRKTPGQCIHGHHLSEGRTRVERTGDYVYVRCLECENTGQLRRYYKRTGRGDK